MHKHGIKIYLHCFDYGRGKQDELNKYCEEVHYYDRNRGANGFSFTIPYIVASRANDRLIENLKKDNYPIIMEGIHTTYFLYKDQLPGRKIILRLHNVEYQYYRRIMASTRSL
ncbi:MAG: mannosyltransferase, partial [Chitinophagaceae bacterium]